MVGVLLVVTLLLAWPVVAHAAGTGMPWEGPIQQFLDSITGPVVQTGAILAIIGLGLALAFGAGGGVLRQAMGIMFGLSLAFAATSFGLEFFGFSGGLAF